MPQNHAVAAINHKHPYCNDIIFDLVRRRLLPENNAKKISEAQFESSSLAEAFVLSLVYERKISVVRALSIRREDYIDSGLATHYIQSLVKYNVISVDRALSIKRDEIECPVEYLTNLGESRTEVQNRKLFLHESDPTITPDHVEHIVSLEFQKGGRSKVDDRELALLHDPDLRRYAMYIVQLEFFTEKTPECKRELELIFSQYSRPYFEIIVDLEFKVNKSVEDEILLENLYLRVCCKLPRKNRALILLQSVLGDGDFPQGCHEQAYYGGGFSLFHNEASERRMIEQTKTVFHSAAKEIVMAQLDVRVVPVKLRETEAMKTYVLDKTDIVRQCLIKYFIGHHSPYSKQLLDVLKEKIIEKIYAKSLTLSDTEKLSSLRSWIDVEAENAVRLD